MKCIYFEKLEWFTCALFGFWASVRQEYKRPDFSI